MASDDIQFSVCERGVATLTMNRPGKRNAFDDRSISVMTRLLEQAANRADVRVIILTGAGKSFSSGADLSWMKAMAQFDEAENVADAKQLARLMRRVADLPKPSIAKVNGDAFGGAVGLICCCDIALATRSARFAFSEVALGLVPAVISPHIVEAIGIRMARRYFLTAERFDAPQALAMGLVHEVVESAQLDDTVGRCVDALLTGGPAAQTACKTLLRSLGGSPDHVDSMTAQAIAGLRVSPEGQEGLAAFLEKRPPAWQERDD